MSNVENIQKLIYEMSIKANMKWFYETHTKKVAEKAEWLLTKLPDANKEIVMLSVWLHDIYYLIDISKEKEHAVLGAIESEKNIKKVLAFQKDSSYTLLRNSL